MLILTCYTKDFVLLVQTSFLARLYLGVQLLCAVTISEEYNLGKDPYPLLVCTIKKKTTP